MTRSWPCPVCPGMVSDPQEEEGKESAGQDSPAGAVPQLWAVHPQGPLHKSQGSLSPARPAPGDGGLLQACPWVWTGPLPPLCSGRGPKAASWSLQAYSLGWIPEPGLLCPGLLPQQLERSPMALRGSVGTGPLAKAGQPHPWTSQIFPEWKQGSNPVCSVGLQSTAGHPGPTEKVGDPGQQPGRDGGGCCTASRWLLHPPESQGST